KKSDEFFKIVHGLARDEQIRTALVLGAAVGDGSTEAFLTGALQNRNKPRVFCMSISNRRWLKLRMSSAAKPSIDWRQIHADCREVFTAELERQIEEIKKSNQIDRFDAVLINSSGFKEQSLARNDLYKHSRQTALVIMDNTSDLDSFHNRQALLDDDNYVLVA